ncbi:DUF5677 domain-containing protein [Robertmurraya sp. FSL R5-0851]|uniref:DUF5677 domain-containing protein n=1 Tax=Robertmurraya sp. FSL R5-0851 TaxID=2921584 RepID=UPI0030FBFE94
MVKFGKNGRVIGQRDVINRKLDHDIKQALNRIAEPIEMLVDYGTYIPDIVKANSEFNEYDISFVTLFSEFLTSLDSIVILIQKGSGDAIKPQLRTMFEQKLSIERMIHLGIRKGSLAYQVTSAKKRIKVYKQLDPNTQQGIAFRKKLGELAVLIPNKSNNIEIAGLEKLLAEEPFKEVNEEYERYVKAKNKKNPNWYNLYSDDKITTLEQLAVELDRQSQYELLYRDLSSYVHGNGSIGRLVRYSEGISLNPTIRQFTNIPTLAIHTIMLVYELYRYILEEFSESEGKAFVDWYDMVLNDKVVNISNTTFNLTY